MRYFELDDCACFSIHLLFGVKKDMSTVDLGSTLTLTLVQFAWLLYAKQMVLFCTKEKVEKLGPEGREVGARGLRGAARGIC